MNLPDVLHFLIVEDQVSDSFLLQRQLKKICAYPEIRFVDSEISLINALKTYIPDMVLTDFNLVGMNAFDVIKIAKNYNAKIPVVVITGNLKYEADREKLLESGAEGFFLKEPINTLNERMQPLFHTIIETHKEQLDKIRNERRKYDSSKSQSDFLREYTFGENQEDNEEKEETKENTSFFDKIIQILKR